MRDYPRDTARRQATMASALVGWPVSGIKHMHALSWSPRINVITSLLQVHQVVEERIDGVQTTDEVDMTEKGSGGNGSGRAAKANHCLACSQDIKRYAIVYS